MPDGDHFCDAGALRVGVPLHAIAANEAASAPALAVENGASDARVWGRWELLRPAAGSLSRVSAT